MVVSATQKLCYDTQGNPHRFLHRPSNGPTQIQLDAYKLAATLRGKTGIKLEAGIGATEFPLFPLCPLCECLPLAGILSTLAPYLTLQH